FNSSVYDTATVSDSGFAFTGTVTFKFFTNGTCTAPASSSESKAVGMQSSTQGPLAAGSYSFNAQYIAGSDTTHTDSAVTACEPLTINPVTSTISTSQSYYPNDTATIGGGGSGTVDFKPYGTCGPT